MKKRFLILLAAITFACSENEAPQIQSSGNVFVAHEGNFGSTNATIGIYNVNDTSYNPAVYSGVNGDFIGDVLQDVIVDGEIAYGILNGSNIVEKFSLPDLNSIETLQASIIDKPRYMTVNGDKAYLTIWGAYDENFSLTDSKVAIIDLNSFEVEKTIPTAPGVEQILNHGGKLFVTRNFFGAYNNLTIIDLSTEEVIADLRIASGPDEIFLDDQNRVWVACTSGALVEINTETNNVAQTVSLEGDILGDVAYYENKVYYFQSNQVKSVDLTDFQGETVVNNVELALPTALDVNPFNGDIYLGDGIDFGSEGEFFHFNASGELVAEFTTGILPTKFIFR